MTPTRHTAYQAAQLNIAMYSDTPPSHVLPLNDDYFDACAPQLNASGYSRRPMFTVVREISHTVNQLISNV